VENRRVANGKTVQRTVLYLGEITSSQENTWHKTLQVFDADSGKQQQKLLSAEDVTIAECDIDSIPASYARAAASSSCSIEAAESTYSSIKSSKSDVTFICCGSGKGPLFLIPEKSSFAIVLILH